MLVSSPTLARTPERRSSSPSMTPRWSISRRKVRPKAAPKTQRPKRASAELWRTCQVRRPPSSASTRSSARALPRMRCAAHSCLGTACDRPRPRRRLARQPRSRDVLRRSSRRSEKRACGRCGRASTRLCWRMARRCGVASNHSALGRRVATRAPPRSATPLTSNRSHLADGCRQVLLDGGPRQ